jgi:hypothetical protein
MWEKTQHKIKALILPLLFHVLQAMKSYLSCRSIHMEALSQQIPRPPFILNGFGRRNIVSRPTRHKSTEHSFSFSRRCPTPRVDPEPGRSLMVENPSLTAAPDPTARVVPGYGGTPTSRDSTRRDCRITPCYLQLSSSDPPGSASVHYPRLFYNPLNTTLSYREPSECTHIQPTF